MLMMILSPAALLLSSLYCLPPVELLVSHASGRRFLRFSLVSLSSPFLMVVLQRWCQVRLDAPAIVLDARHQVW